MPMTLPDLAGALTTFAEAAGLANTCADACLTEPDVAQLADCIALDRLVADACELAGRVLGRRLLVGAEQHVLALALAATEACAAECGRHADTHAHCGACAAACERAATSARSLLDPVGPSGAPLEEPKQKPLTGPGGIQTSGR
jgi:hypothetical protein